MSKSAPYQKSLRERRKAKGLKTLTRYVPPNFIPLIDEFIKKLNSTSGVN